MKIKLDKEPYIPSESWKVEYNRVIKDFDPKDLQLHLEPEQKNGYIKGRVLAERMKDEGLNANVLDYLLAHPNLIPEDWKGRYVYFWGTIYRDSRGVLYVRYLYWDDGQWGWGCSWLDFDWHEVDPAAVLASSLNSDSKSFSDTLPLVLEINGYKYRRE